MSDEEKQEFLKEDIKKILGQVNIIPPTDINKLDKAYVCDKIIMDAQDGKYIYSTSKISELLREFNIDHQKILDCNYRVDFKNLFTDEINIPVPDNGGRLKKVTSMGEAIAKKFSHDKNSNVIEKLECPTNFSEAVKLYNEIHKNNKIEFLNENCDVTRNIEIYFTDSFGKNTGVAITKSDKIWITPPLQLNPDFYMIVTARENRPVVWGNFLEDKRYYYLNALSENVRVNASDTNTNYKIIFANNEFTRFFSKDIKIFVKTLPVKDEVLCIDFGTSNTTAGTWFRTENGIEPKIVEFDDLTKPNRESSPFLPTIVYLKDLKSDENKFLFGYEAKKHIIDKEYDLSGNIFYNIKQWIVADDDFRIMSGTDEKGEECERYTLFAKNIIIEYIKYVIINAEIKLKKKCKRLHFSAPVRCKNLFIAFLTEKFAVWKNEYEILPADESLDEAIAIIYKRISEFRTEFENDTREADGELMVIDCGGGTTDGASCSYHFSKTDTGTKIAITTKFENGQTAFGGNDLTYRIFQFLKIRLRDYYCGINNENTTKNILNNLEHFNKINEQTGNPTTEIEDFLSHIDACISAKRRFDCYDQLDEESKKAEQVIPTDFNNNNIVGTGDRNPKLARRNFNYLWQLAEEWKIALYSGDATFSANFNKVAKKLQTDLSTKNIYFYVDKSRYGNQTESENNQETADCETKEDNNQSLDLKLEKVDGMPEISLNREELIALLKPQIYYLLSVMFLKADGTERTSDELPNKYRKLHLTGQSCRIGLFQDMLKEFVPGKNLRNGIKIEEAEKKKLACIEGCIQYLSDKTYGKISAKIKIDMPNIIYTVMVDRGSGTTSEILLNGGKIYTDGDKTYMPKITIHKREMSVGWIRLRVCNNLIQENNADYRKDVEIKAYFPDGEDVKDSTELKNKIQANAPDSFSHWEIKGEGNVLDDLIGRLMYEKTDTLLIFAIPNKDGFSFTLWQIVKYRQKGVDGENNIETLRIMGSDNLQYQKVEFISRFEGQNCK